MKSFDLEAALRGEPVVDNHGKDVLVTKLAIPDKSAFLVAQYTNGDIVSSFQKNGVSTWMVNTWLMMKTTQRTYYINLWDSPSFHYTKYDSLEAAKQDTRGLAHNNKSQRVHRKLNPEPIEITVEE